MIELKLIPRPRSVIYGSGMLRGSPDIFSKPPKRVLDTSIPSEGYVLTVNESGISVRCSDNGGYFYARQTLEQIIFQCGRAVPFVTVSDAPRFAYRGFMVDCVRHFFDIDELKIIIDAASKFKLNKFHWPLMNDQGWRAEIPSMPELTEKSSVRESSHFGRVFENEPHGGYFTCDEMRDIVSFCAERNIEVIPEFDMPGHVTALLAAHPELSCRGKEIKLKNTGGIFNDILCAGKEETFDTVFEIIDSLCDIFGGNYFHIGGDEAPKKRWKKCPECRAKLRELGLDSFEQLHGSFMNRVAEHLRKKGKVPISWNESLRGKNLDEDIAVQFWMGDIGECADAAENGRKIIISNYFHYYLDYPYGMTPLNKAYSYDPVESFGVKGAENVFGIEAPIWTEHIRDFDRMTYMFFPRIIAVAERAWTNEALCGYESFRERLIRLLPMLDKRIHYAPVSHWDPSPAERLTGTASFFARSVNFENVKNLFD